MNKKGLFILLPICLLLSCHKPAGCTSAIVTLSAPSCHGIGVILKAFNILPKIFLHNMPVEEMFQLEKNEKVMSDEFKDRFEET